MSTLVTKEITASRVFSPERASTRNINNKEKFGDSEQFLALQKLLTVPEFLGLILYSKFLHSTSERFTQINISLRIGRDAVHMKELSDTMTAVAAKEADDLECLAIEYLNFLITSIRDIDELLLFIW